MHGYTSIGFSETKVLFHHYSNVFNNNSNEDGRRYGIKKYMAFGNNNELDYKERGRYQASTAKPCILTTTLYGRWMSLLFSTQSDEMKEMVFLKSML